MSSYRRRTDPRTGRRYCGATLKREKLRLNWRRYQQSRAAVRVTIETMLDEGLPEVYDPKTYQRAAEAVCEHVFEQYVRNDRWLLLGPGKIRCGVEFLQGRFTMP